MTSRAKLILIVALVLAALVAIGTLWARAIGLLQPGAAAPLLGFTTLLLLGLVLLFERHRASAARE